MSFEKIRAATIKRLTDSWVSGAPSALNTLAKIELPNVRFTRPTSGAWASASLVFADRDAAAIGGAKVRTIGILYFMVFTAEDSGTKVLNDCGHHFATIFDNAQVALLDSSGWVSFGFVRPSGSLQVSDGHAHQAYRVTWFSDKNT